MNLKLKTMLGLAIFGVVISMSRCVPVNAATPDAETAAHDGVGDALPQGESSAFTDEFGARITADGAVLTRPRSLSEIGGLHVPVARERLIDAIADDDFDLARELVVSGNFDVNFAGYYGEHTALSTASYHWLVPGGADMIIFLLEHGANPEFIVEHELTITDDNGNSYRPNIYEAWQESLRHQRHAGVRLDEDVVNAIDRAFRDAIARRHIND